MVLSDTIELSNLSGFLNGDPYLECSVCLHLVLVSYVDFTGFLYLE